MTAGSLAVQEAWTGSVGEGFKFLSLVRFVSIGILSPGLHELTSLNKNPPYVITPQTCLAVSEVREISCELTRGSRSVLGPTWMSIVHNPT